MYVNAAKATEACEVLAIDLEGLTAEGLKAAYRDAAKANHPDTGEYDAAKWAKIGWSKDVLERWLVLRAQANSPETPGVRGDCRACAGKGFIQRRNGFNFGPRMMCVMCGGTGNPKKHDREE